MTHVVPSLQCGHPRSVVTARKVKGGGTQYVQQCVACGAKTSQALPKDQYASMACPFDEDLYALGEKANSEHFKEVKEKERAEFFREYNQYLSSREWQEKRKAVLLRAQGICEGCRSAKATQVHHLHYRRVFREMLFDLVAVCDECHDSCHEEKE